jgi:simple sugar transport system permease protein
MSIFLRGLGEFLTKGGDISGFPVFLRDFGHGFIANVPAPLIIFFIAVATGMCC